MVEETDSEMAVVTLYIKSKFGKCEKGPGA
jgi:hypothetical protein